MKRFYVLLLIFILFYTTVYGTPSTSSELGSLLTKVQTLQANFTQTVYDNRNQPVQRSYGKMAMQRPDKFRWEVIKPIPQLIISNQSRLWIYDPDLEQVTIRSLKQEVGDAPTMLLNYSNKTLDRDYIVNILQKKSSSLRWFELSPKNPDNMFATVQLGFENGVVNQMRLQDNIGHVTLIQFTNIKTNTLLPSTLFVFKAPKGVDVLDETKPG
ncbi:MAG TPA: outer membrane lipoprotein chaperone LolA [Gammaproteobacteria bacterium]|nr:outer membrane lipoprotein chaperone LolA [Gammaproteobacteria bacterium]